MMTLCVNFVGSKDAEKRLARTSLNYNFVDKLFYLVFTDFIERLKADKRILDDRTSPRFE